MHVVCGIGQRRSGTNEPSQSKTFADAEWPSARGHDTIDAALEDQALERDAVCLNAGSRNVMPAGT